MKERSKLTVTARKPAFPEMVLKSTESINHIIDEVEAYRSISINERGSNYEQQVIIFCCKLDVTRVILVHYNWYSIASVYFLENIN